MSEKEKGKELTNKLYRIRKIKNEVKSLYKEKYQLEQDVILAIEETPLEQLPSLLCENVSEKERELAYEVVEVFKKKMDYEKLMAHYPQVYEWGMKTIFDFEKALRSFEDSKTFWRIIKECQIVKVEKALEKKGQKGKKRGKKYR
jgi:hypothetical protein